MERKIPYSLLGKPTLFNAWVHLKDNPDMRPSDVGRMFGTRASDGTRILKELRKINPNLRGALILPGNLKATAIGAIKVWNCLNDMICRFDVPLSTTLDEVSKLAGLHRTSVCKFLKQLEKESLIEYENSGRLGIVVHNLFFDGDP